MNIVSLAEGACLKDQTKLNTIRDKTNYLVETTVECGFKNANNLYAHLHALGINRNVETRSLMRQISGSNIHRYSIIAVVSNKNPNRNFIAHNLIFILGKIDNKKDALSNHGEGHFLIKLDLNGNVLKTVQLEERNRMSIQTVNSSPFLTDYLINYWVNYYESILGGVPASSQGMAGK